MVARVCARAINITKRSHHESLVTHRGRTAHVLQHGVRAIQRHSRTAEPRADRNRWVSIVDARKSCRIHVRDFENVGGRHIEHRDHADAELSFQSAARRRNSVHADRADSLLPIRLSAALRARSAKSWHDCGRSLDGERKYFSECVEYIGRRCNGGCLWS